MHVAFGCLLGFVGKNYWQIAEQNLEDVIERREDSSDARTKADELHDSHSFQDDTDTGDKSPVPIIERNQSTGKIRGSTKHSEQER